SRTWSTPATMRSGSRPGRLRRLPTGQGPCLPGPGSWSARPSLLRHVHRPGDPALPGLPGLGPGPPLGGEEPVEHRGQGGGVDVVLLALEGGLVGVGGRGLAGASAVSAMKPKLAPPTTIRVGTVIARAMSVGMV